MYEEGLEGTALMLGLDPAQLPEVEVRRVIEPVEWDRVFVECMAEQGYHRQADGSWPGIPVEQKDAFNTAVYVCHGSYPPPTVYSQPWDEGQKRAMYRYTVDSLVPCLQEQGYPVDQEPSEEVFISSWDTQPWVPYTHLDLSALSQVQFEDLTRTCPQTPPLDLLQR